MGNKAVTTLKGLAGAVIGALPGLAVWIILGKLGFVFSAVGILIAMGIFFGYAFFVKDEDLPVWLMFVICIGVFLCAMVISEKIVWTWTISDALKTYLSTYRDELITSVMLENPDFSRSEVSAELTDDLYNEIVLEVFGVTEGTFGECFSNFSILLEKLEMKTDYIFSLIKSTGFGLLGGIAFFAKLANK